MAAFVVLLCACIGYLTFVVRASFSLTSLPQAASLPSLVISQVFTGGGSNPNTFRSDFVELFNRGTTTVNLTGWTLQYATAAGNAWEKTVLSGSLPPGGYYLIELASAPDDGKKLPAPDARGSQKLSVAGGKLALVRHATTLGKTTCPTNFASAGIVDFVGYGNAASCAEGTPILPANNSQAFLRRNDGCQDTNQNRADFVLDQPMPRNSASTLNRCQAASTARADLIVTTQTSGASMARFPFAERKRAITTQSSGATVAPRGAVALLIDVYNAGPDTATNVVVTENLPDGFSKLVPENNGQVIGNSITWPIIPQLPPSTHAIFTFSAQAPTVMGKYQARAVANADTFDPHTGNNTSLFDVFVTSGALFTSEFVEMTITNDSQCSTSFAVEVRLRNLGELKQPDTRDAEFLARFSPEAVYSGSCSASKGRCRGNSGSEVVRWDGEIEPQEEVTITYYVQVLSTSPPPIPFCITSTVFFDGDNDGVNESSLTREDCAEYHCSTGEPLENRLPPTTPVSDQKAGSLLFFNFYSSSSASPEQSNTRINITNTADSNPAYVHLFFVAGESCEISDTYLCLSPNQTASFLVSDLDPDVTGYLIALAVDSGTGCPINFNYLIGDEYVKLSSGQHGNLGAEAFATLLEEPCLCDDTMTTAEISLDGIAYNQAPHTLSISNVPSLADNNSTLLVLNRVGGDLTTAGDPIGVLSGLLFDDMENGFSFMTTAGCQLRQSLSASFPRTTPRFPQVVPSGHSGWLKISPEPGIGLLGTVLQFNPDDQFLPNAFNGARNLHKVSFAETITFRVPLFALRCDNK